MLVTKNYKTAIYWYKKACENGLSSACTQYKKLKNN